MKLNLVTVPNPVLGQKTEAIKQIDKRILEIVREMKRVLLSCKDPEGVGLAAPQVGLPLRLFITKPYPRSEISVYINPKIVRRSDQLTSRKNSLEGCLSVTNTWSNIVRPRSVILEFTNEDGQTLTKKFEGWEAQIIQHEMDHLEGILFTYRAMEQDKHLYRIEKDTEGKEELVPLEL